MHKLYLIIFFCLSVITRGEAIYFKHLGISDGLAQLSIMSIYQDELGRMWFGTQEGISVYDGNRIVNLQPGNNVYEASHLIRNHNNHIVGDRDGNILINSDFALIKYNIRTQEFVKIRESSTRVLKENKGKVWVGVSDSVFIWNSKTKQLDLQFTIPSSMLRLTDIHIDSSGKCWIGSMNGLYIRNSDGTFDAVLDDEDVYSIFEDSKYNTWIGSRMNGLYRRDIRGQICHFKNDPLNSSSLASNQVRQIAEDNYGNIWIGTFNGLNKYNSTSNSFEAFKRSPLSGSLTHSSVFPIFKDKQGTMWIGTYYGGVNYFNPETDFFSVYTDNPSREDCLNYNFVGQMVEDKDHNLWICTEGGGLNFFNRTTRKFKYYIRKDDEAGNAIAHNNLKAIAYSEKYNKMYIGTHTGGLSILDLKTSRFYNPLYEDSNYAKDVGDRINRMQIWNDLLIFTTDIGMYTMDMETQKITRFRKDKHLFSNTCFTVDKQGFIWIASGPDIWRINLTDTNQYERFQVDNNMPGTDRVSQIVEDKKGRVFFSTLGAGLFCLTPERSLIHYTAQNSHLPSNYCYEVALSALDQIIITGDKGITFFDPQRETFRIVERGTALPLAGLNSGCGVLACSNGEIFVGGTNGMVSFFEQQLFNISKEYNLYFSDLYINNSLVRAGDGNDVLNSALSYTKQIELAHDQNNLIFNFATNNYVSTFKEANYEYRLEGFEDKWMNAENYFISYTNLNSGKYKLVIRELQYDPDIETQQIITMDVIIHSPWYASWWAYTLYLILLVSILYSFYKFKRSELQMENSLMLERKEKESIEKLNQAKIQFFSNISHEFRTPLTLILSQLELLLQSGSLAPSVYNKLLKVYKNSSQMLNLIGELLDFRKLEAGHLHLRVVELNLVGFINDIYMSFSEYAKAKDITYDFLHSSDRIDVWCDPKQMQKVIYNLLSNAFKFVNKNGTVEIVLEEKEQEVIIKVIDNGDGIPKESLSKIFDSFYQAANSESSQGYTSGTGIGLTLSKSIVELHHGTIAVQSSLDYGTIFTVTLLKGCEAFSETEIVNRSCESLSLKEVPLLSSPIDEETSEGSEDIETVSPKERYKILLVEDNEDILQVLKSLFSPSYEVMTAVNGKDGWEKVSEFMPDIVVSDIMMPEMSGTELCMKLKSDFNLCHIPVVLLTALSSEEQNIEGLKRGADDYVCKPFKAKVLYARCNNLLRNRIILQKKFSEQKDFDVHTLASNPMDQKFLDQINDIIERNLDNQEFDITNLAKDLGLSRSSLYTKFKALTGMTPNEFVLNSKLKKAAHIIENNAGMQIAEISEKLGFGSPRYFTRCFKAQFGMTPADYRKKPL